MFNSFCIIFIVIKIENGADMNNDRRNKLIILSVLIGAILVVSIGYAAFSNNINISTNAGVTPNPSDFKVVFSNSINSIDETNVVPTLTPNTLQAVPGRIDNLLSPTMEDISVTFTEPGQKAVYNFYVYNAGNYTAYLNSINFRGNKTCTAGTGASASLVNSACDDIVMTLTVGGITTNTTRTDITGETLLAGQGKAVTLTIEYLSNGDRADGPFSVEFQDVSLYYVTTSGVNEIIVDDGNLTSPYLYTLSNGTKALDVSNIDSVTGTDYYVLRDGTEIKVGDIITLDDGTRWLFNRSSMDDGYCTDWEYGCPDIVTFTSVNNIYLEGDNAGKIDTSGTLHEIIIPDGVQYPNMCDESEFQEFFSYFPSIPNLDYTPTYFRTLGSVSLEMMYVASPYGWSYNGMAGCSYSHGATRGIYPTYVVTLSNYSYKELITLPNDKVKINNKLNIAIISSNLPSTVTWREVSQTSNTITLVTDENTFERRAYNSNSFEDSYHIISLVNGNSVGGTINSNSLRGYGTESQTCVSESCDYDWDTCVYDEEVGYDNCEQVCNCDYYDTVITNLPSSLTDKNYVYYNMNYEPGSMASEWNCVGTCDSQTGTRLMITIPK